MATGFSSFDDLLTGWATAERNNDSDAMEDHIVKDFHMVGPLGFILDRDQWLQRYRTGDLVNSAFRLEEMQPREYGETVVAIGVQDQTTTYQGRDASGRFRITVIAVRDGDSFKLAGYHLSPVTPAAGQQRVS